jgi:hypothetical protein
VSDNRAKYFCSKDPEKMGVGLNVFGIKSFWDDKFYVFDDKQILRMYYFNDDEKWVVTSN